MAGGFGGMAASISRDAALRLHRASLESVTAPSSEAVDAVAVAVAARSGSSIMSAVFSTAPTGVPLSLWLVHRAACTVEGGGKAATVSIDRFLVAVIKGGLALAAFALGALTLLRTLGDAAPPPLAALLSAGFGAWAAAWGLLRHV